MVRSAHQMIELAGLFWVFGQLPLRRWLVWLHYAGELVDRTELLSNLGVHMEETLVCRAGGAAGDYAGSVIAFVDACRVPGTLPPGASRASATRNLASARCVSCVWAAIYVGPLGKQ
jgi:hypothetical protein